MPLVQSPSRRAVSENIRREREAGRPQRQAVAIALETQRRAQQAKHHSSGDRNMAENLSHAPGKEIGGGADGTRQRHRMGAGEGALPGGNFGVGPLPGTHALPSHGSHMPHDGVTLHDDHRSNPPNMHQGDGSMHATAHSHHGPHHHPHGHHHTAPEGTRPHHIGGAQHTKPKRGH